MGEETPAGGGGRDLAAFAAMPSAWVATITLALSAAYLATGAGTTRPYRRRSRRIAGLRARDALDVHDFLARDDSAREDGSDASDDAERGARLPEMSPSDDLAPNGTAPAKTPTRAPRRGLLARALEPVQLALLLARTLDLALFALLAWGVMYVGHDKLCGVVMRCECNFPWMGGWSRCNAHNTHGGPRCPWCTAPYWTSVLTQKSCAAVMIAAYALGAGDAAKDPEAKDPGTQDARGDGRDARRLPRVASRCASYLELARTDENRRPACAGSNPRVVDDVSDSDSEEAASVAFVDDEFDDDAFDDDDGRRRGAVRVPRALPALALALRSLAIFPKKWRETTRLVVSDADVRVGRFLAPLAWWFAFEMFWQAFFYLWLGARQDPAYPCFLVCWGDPLGPGNNPPSPLSMLDAPPMQRLAETFGKTG